MIWPKGIVIFSAMRSGSNYLEEGIAQWPGFRSYGEVFNPSFIGHPDASSIPDLTLERRKVAPEAVCNSLVSGAEIPVLRWFDGHDQRAQLHMILDPDWAKIRLTRPVLDRYASLKLAQASGQWRVRTAKDRKKYYVSFEKPCFETFCLEQQTANFHMERLLKGQECFRIDYSDLRERRVWKWLANWLGTEQPFIRPRPQLVRQNPGPATAKFLNPGDIPRNAHLSRAEPPSKVTIFRTSAEVYFNLEADPCTKAEGSDGDHLGRHLTGETAQKWQNTAQKYRTIAVIEDPVKRATRLLQSDPCDARAFVQALRLIRHTPRPLRPIRWQPQLWQIPIADFWVHEINVAHGKSIPYANMSKKQVGIYSKIIKTIWPEDYEAFGFTDITPPDAVQGKASDV